MNRRVVAGVVAGLCALLVTSACSSSKQASGGSAGNGDITLKFLGADYGSGASDSSTAYWQDIADRFHAANPQITVKVQTINWGDYDTKVKTQIQNKDYPDILQGEFFPDYAKDNLVAPLSDVLSNPDQGLAVFKSGFSVGGTQYATSFDTSARALFYNKKAFAAAGITAAPTTWAELKSDADALKSKGYVGYAMPLGSEEAQAESYLWMLGSGGGWQDASGKYQINSPQNIEAFQFMKGLVAAGDTEPNPASYNRTANAAKDFAAGKVGMELNGPFLTATIASAGVLKSSDYAAVPVPGKTGPLSSTLGVADAIQAFKSDASKTAAIKKFLDFALDDANQLAWAKKYALLPGTQSAADSLRNDPVLGAFVQALPHTVLYPSDAAWTATVLPAVKQTIGTAATGDPSKVLGNLQKLATTSN